MRPARDNPFRSECIQTLSFRPQSVTWEELLQRLDELGRRAALIGPHGSGKTTLLRRLGEHLRDSGFCVLEQRIRVDEPNPSVGELREFAGPADEETILLFDGADHLSPRRWRALQRAARPAAGLIVTSHGTPLLPTLIETATSVDLTQRLVAELIGEGQAATMREELAMLFHAHQGNVRDVLRALYDRWAEDAGL